MIEVIGWLSTFCFTIAGAPQVLKAVKDGHADGVATGFLLFWYLGNVFGTMYAVSTGSIPLGMGFLTSVAFGSILWQIKLSRKKKQ